MIRKKEKILKRARKVNFLYLKSIKKSRNAPKIGKVKSN